MAIVYPLPNRNTVNLDVPTFTLDVNQVTIRPPAKLPSELQGIVCLEWNYFEPHTVELCVTPQTHLEIVQDVPISQLGSAAYARFVKSELYKSRPPDAILGLSSLDSDALWTDMRDTLFPSVTNEVISPGQLADVNQVFFHAISSGSTASNSVFVTRDHNFLEHADLFQNRYGVLIMEPNHAWSLYAPEYGLEVPTEPQSQALWLRQQELVRTIQIASS